MKKLKLQNLNYYIHTLKNKGLFHIIISSSISKIVSFISAFFLPRFLSKSDYGLLSYVDTINNYIMLINGMGLVNATIRYCALDEEDEIKKGYFLFTVYLGILFDIIMVILSVIYYLNIPLSFREANQYLILLSLIPVLTFLYEDIQLLLRATFENKKYSFLSFFYSFIMVMFQVILAYFMGINGVIIGRYTALAICLIIGLFFIKNLSIIKAKVIYPSFEVMKNIVRFSIVMMTTNAASLVMTLNETLILSLLLHDELALADYKVASYILVISLFFTQSIMVFVFPYFVKHIKDKVWIWNNFKNVFYINAAIMIPLHILLIIFAPLILSILFGNKYINAVSIMRMLLIASLIQSVLRGVVGNILGGIGEEKFNLKINILLVIIHYCIDYIAVSKFGIQGSAIALCIVYLISGILMINHLKKVCLNNKEEIL